MKMKELWPRGGLRPLRPLDPSMAIYGTVQLGLNIPPIESEGYSIGLCQCFTLTVTTALRVHCSFQQTCIVNCV